MKTCTTSRTALAAAALCGLIACSRAPDPPAPVLVPIPVVVQNEPAPAQAPGPVATDLVSLSAQLNGSGEVPVVLSDATGTLEATLVPGTQVLSWTLNYNGLSGPLTGAHFHGPAMAGQNAGVAVPISGPLGSPVSGSVTLNAAQVAEMRAGQWYVNLHTEAHPDGEIRGQLQVRR